MCPTTTRSRGKQTTRDKLLEEQPKAKLGTPCQEFPVSKTGLCRLSATISVMINSASHNAPRHLITTAETDQLTRFCTFLRVARMECRRQGPVCEHQRKRTSIKRGNRRPAPWQRNPSRLLRRKRNTGKRKKSTNAQQHIWQRAKTTSTPS